MNRKQFLGSLAAMFAAPFVKAEAIERPIQVGDRIHSSELKNGQWPTTITIKGEDLRFLTRKRISLREFQDKYNPHRNMDNNNFDIS